MSSATGPEFAQLVGIILIIGLIVPVVFFILFYYYLSQLVGINQSLKEISALLWDHWFPDDEVEKKKP